MFYWITSCIFLSRYVFKTSYEPVDDLRYVETCSSVYLMKFCCIWTHNDLVFVPNYHYAKLHTLSVPLTFVSWRLGNADQTFTTQQQQDIVLTMNAPLPYKLKHSRYYEKRLGIFRVALYSSYVSARCVPRMLTDKNKASRVAMCQAMLSRDKGTHLTSHLAIFGCSQQWRTLFVVAHFQVVSLLQQRFSSGQNEPLKKRLLRPCNRGVSVVENVYVYRVITLRNDCIFSFLGWVIFF